ncbi:cadherin domain-containing protein, partial [Flavobacteriaceae bacterium]|nr:cadherin domain-containing protein [Flavobacteriaceae bacterium]
RINYDLNTTELWVNPNLSNFDYANPSSADAQASYDIEFDLIELVFRSGASIDEISVFKLIPLPEISQTKIALNNSTVSVTFSDAVYGGSANATSTIEVSDFELSISGGSASLSSSTPSSIIVSGTTIGLGIPLTGTPDGNEILTILPASNSSIFSVSGNPASTSQTSNTIQLISDIVTSGLMIYLDASNENSYSGSGSNWYDLTSNGNDGVITGTTFSSNGGEGFIFGGSSSDYITVADDTSLDMDNNQMTISYEITPDLNGSNWSPVIQKGVSATACSVGNLNYYTWYGNNDLKIDFEGNSDLRGQLYNATSDDISNGKKIMITITIDQSNAVKTFINGELKHLLTHSGQVLGPATNGPLVIGYCPDPSGKISSIMIYDRALTGQEIFQNYDALNDVPPTNISLTSNTISETVSIGSMVGTLSATDSDTSIRSLTFSFTSSGDARDDDNGSFTISGTSLLTSSTLDYETKASYNIYLKVSDGTSDFEKAFTVSVTNVLEPITDVGFVEPSIVTNGLVLHLDAGNSNSYSGSGNTWNDLSGNSNHFDINNVATHNNDGYFLFNNTLVGGSGMIGPASNSFGLSQTNHTIELVMTATAARGSIINFRGDSHDYAINVHVPWSNNNIYYDVGGCCGGGDRISGARNIVGQKIHIIFRSRPSTNPKREVILNGISILNSGGNNTSTNNFTNTPVTLGGFMYNNNSDHAVSARLYSVKVYNRALTDAEVASNFTSSITITGGTSTSTVSVDEEVDIGTVVGSLVATDADSTTHTFTLVSGNGDAHNGLFSISGTNLLVNGFIDYEQTPSLSIRIQATDGQSTYSKALTVEVNDINEPPVIVSTELATDNSVVSVTFSEAVFNNNGGSGALQANDFSLTLTGGTASLSGSTPSSISNQGNTYGLGIPVTGNINGSEVLKVLPAATNSIYDAGAATASTTQTSNTINLNGDGDG